MEMMRGLHIYTLVIIGISGDESGSKLFKGNDLRSNRNVHEMS